MLDASKIAKNPGRRAMAKLMLNSFWGKVKLSLNYVFRRVTTFKFFQFGQRTNMNKTSYFTEPYQYFDVTLDPANIITDVLIISDALVAVTHKKEDDFAEVMQNTNPVIAAYTTAIARLKLYSYIKELQDRVLYFDTDSIIYLTDLMNSTQTLVPTGWSLGEMTNELKDYGADAFIEEFVSGGPKNYAYKVAGTSDGKKHTNIKVKGITLSNTTEKRVNFTTIRNMVLKFVKELHKTELNIILSRIEVQRKTHEVLTKNVTKKFRIVYDKRIVFLDGTTIPYGWKFD